MTEVTRTILVCAGVTTLAPYSKNLRYKLTCKEESIKVEVKFAFSFSWMGDAHFLWEQGKADGYQHCYRQGLKLPSPEKQFSDGFYLIQKLVQS